MDIEFVLDKKCGIPLYIQLKNEIMEAVKIGKLKIGTQMPTERELAAHLKTSRNTVSSAYNLLEQEGVLISYQGRGTFVAEEANSWKQHNLKDKLFKLIDLGLEEALEMGLDTQEYLSLVRQRIKEKEEMIKKVNAIFVECNIEQAREFARQLSQETNLSVTPVVLPDLANMDEKVREVITKSQLIITTFNHVNDVRERTSSLEKEVFGVAINPSLEPIVKIARYPRNTEFGFFSLSREFLFKAENALKSAGLDNININASISRDEKEIGKILEEVDAVIVSPGRNDEVGRLVGGTKEVIKFNYDLDQDSVKAILSKIIELKK